MTADVKSPKEVDAADSSNVSRTSVNSFDKSAVHSLPVSEKGLNADGTAKKSSQVAEAEVEHKSTSDLGDSQAEYEYPKGLKLYLITIALCLAVFCMALDNTIIATAIPRITDDFKALSDVGWYISVYLLTTCSFQLIFGKLYSFYSVKWTFLVTMAIFEIGSIICAVAPTSVAFIVGRAIAGLGSAGIFSGAILIMTYTVPLNQRPLYTGIIGGMYGIASVAGPLLGGVFTASAKLTWRFCFWINLPFGFITALFLVFFFKSPGAKASKSTLKQKLAQMDLPGTAVFLPAVICLLLALQWGGSKYNWGNGRIIALLVLAGLLVAAFIAVQTFQGEKATVPPRVLRNRNIWSTALFSFLLGGAFFIMMFYLPIWFQAIKGASPVKSGIMALPFILAMVIFSIVAGALVTIVGYYTPMMYIAAIATPISIGLLSTLKVDSGAGKWIGYQVLLGLGVGCGFQQSLIVAQAVLDLADVPVGTAIMMFSQILGGAVMAGAAQNVFTNQLIKNLIKYVPDFDAASVLKSGATELKNIVPGDRLDAVLFAYNEAIAQTFYVATALAALLVFPLFLVQWVNIKGKKIEMAAA